MRRKAERAIREAQERLANLQAKKVERGEGKEIRGGDGSGTQPKKFFSGISNRISQG